MYVGIIGVMELEVKILCEVMVNLSIMIKVGFIFYIGELVGNIVILV